MASKLGMKTIKGSKGSGGSELGIRSSMSRSFLDKRKSRSRITRLSNSPDASPPTSTLPPPETPEDKMIRWSNMVGDNPTSVDKSCVFGLRRYHSEPNLTQNKMLGQDFQSHRMVSKQKPFGISNTMEDIILTHSSYPALVKESSSGEARTYVISEKLRRDWEDMAEQETQRFSFYDALFKAGCIVDSLEVPSRMDEVSHLIEADVAEEEKLDYGRLVFKSKTVFTGNIHKGHFAGPGRYVWLDGTIYQGDFLDGLMHGEGLLFLPDGCFFEGQFINGERTGWGIYTTPTGLMYAGDWLKGAPNGQGKVWYNPLLTEDDYFDGPWVKGIIHGKGTRQYANGDRYVGNFLNGIRVGKGTMVWLTQRQVYKGEWLDGQPSGFGEHVWYLPRSPTCPYPERNVYKGDFLKGERHGIGRMVYASGAIYDGKWQHGLKHGKGIYVNPAGEMLFAVFRHGSISGGADMPLHVPTYACKYRTLVSVMQHRLHTVDSAVAKKEEEYLSEVVTRFLTRIRSLYKRAGYLGQWYGNQGHYPQWMKKQDPNRHHLQHRHLYDGEWESSHSQMHDVDDDMMEEPWIHGHSPHYGSPDHINPVTRFGLWLLLKDCPGILSDITMAELDTVWSTVPSISFQTRHNPFEPIQLWQFLQCLIVVATMLYIEIPKRNYHYEVNNEEDEEPCESDEEKKSSSTIGSDDLKIVLQSKDNLKKVSPKPSNEAESFKKRRKSSGGSGNSGNQDKPRRKSSTTSSGSNKSRQEAAPSSSVTSRKSLSRRGKKKLTSVPSAEQLIKVEDATASTQTEGDVPTTTGEAQTIFYYDEGDDTIRDFLLSEAFELLLTDFLIPCLERRPGKHLPEAPNPLPSLADLYAAFSEVTPYKDVISARDFLLSTLQHRLSSADGNSIYWTRSRNLRTPDIEMEKLLTHFRESPSSTDEIDLLDYAFLSEKLSNTEIYTEEIKAEVFGTEGKEEGRRRSSIKIFGSGNIVFGDEEQKEQEGGGGDGPEAGNLKIEFEDDTDNLPLAEEDLTAVPFLWATEPVCSHKTKNGKTFDNVGLADVLQILHQFYPKTCDYTNAINLEFNLTFGDWMWLTIMTTKLSADRAFCAWMRSESKLEHKPGKCRQMGLGLPGSDSVPTTAKPKDSHSSAKSN